MKCELFSIPYQKFNNGVSFKGGAQAGEILDGEVQKISFGPVLTSDKLNSKIGNFYKVDEHFYRGAQPGIDETQGGLINYAQLKDDLKYLRDKHNIDVVLNLRNPNDNNTKHIELEMQAISELNEEAKALGNAKEMKMVHIPMYAENIVRSEQVEEILDVFQQNPKNNIYVHCRSGNDRTGVVTALRRVWTDGTKNGVSFHDIRQEMIRCGHNQSWYPRLISSLAACLRYMGITPDFGKIPNAKGEKNFLADFYQMNRMSIKSFVA